MAAAYVGPGEMDKARASAEHWRNVWPASVEDIKLNNERRFHPQPEFICRVNDDLRMAGIDIP